MNKKYELLKDDCIEREGKKLFRIRALKDVGCGVKAGALGGYVASEQNLSQKGDAWIFDGAFVFDNAYVFEDAHIGHGVRIDDNARVRGTVQIKGSVWIFGHAQINGGA